MGSTVPALMRNTELLPGAAPLILTEAPCEDNFPLAFTWGAKNGFTLQEPAPVENDQAKEARHSEMVRRRNNMMISYESRDSLFGSIDEGVMPIESNTCNFAINSEIICCYPNNQTKTVGVLPQLCPMKMFTGSLFSH